MPENDIREALSRELRSNAVLIPGGKFVMGSNIFESESPPHVVYTEPFLLSAFLVTKAQFVGFLNATRVENEVDGIYLYLNTFNKMSKVRKEKAGYVIETGFEDHPITCVNWLGASAFASWVGGRLPTEAEWERAARGNGNGKFPWGDKAPDTSLANFGENVSFTTPVGKYPPNEYGLYDMVGNASQWCSDWYSKDYYKISGTVDPRGPDTGVDKVIRGGGWAYSSDALRCTRRDKRWERVGGTNLSLRVAFGLNQKKIKSKNIS